MARVQRTEFRLLGESVFGSYWYSLQLPTHYQQFTPRTIRSLLAQTGFRLVKLIHQRNVLNITGSLALWLREALPRRAWGPRLLQFTHDPSMWGYLALAPPARILSWLRQGGRLTILARPATTSE